MGVVPILGVLPSCSVFEGKQMNNRLFQDSPISRQTHVQIGIGSHNMTLRCSLRKGSSLKKHTPYVPSTDCVLDLVGGF